MLQRYIRREVSSANRRRAEHVGVEVQLERVARDRVRNGGETAPRAVHDPAQRVAETRLRARRRQPGRAPKVDEREKEHAQNERGGSRRRRSHRFPEVVIRLGRVSSRPSHVRDDAGSGYGSQFMSAR